MEELNDEIKDLKQNSSKSVELLQKIQTLESEVNILISSKEDEIKKISDEKDALCEMSMNAIMQKKSQELDALMLSKDNEKIKELETAQILCKKTTENLNMQIQSKNVELDALKNRIVNINDKIFTIDQRNKQLIKEKNEAEVKASKTEASQKKIEEELKLLKQQNGKDIDKKIQELTEKLRQKDVELGTINQKVLSLDEKATEVSRIIDNITKEKNAVEQQKQRALDELEELRKRLSDNTANSSVIERLQTEIGKKNDALESMEKEKKIISDELEAKTQEITKLTSTISFTETKETKDTEKLKEEIVTLKETIKEKDKTCSVAHSAMPNTLSSNPREQCKMPDITELVNKYQKIFIQDPDVLFNLLLLFVINDISMYLKTIKIDDPLFTNLILVFIPLLSLFTIDMPDSLIIQNPDDTQFNYQNTNYITFKKIFNIIFNIRNSTIKPALIRIYNQHITTDKIKEIFKNIIITIIIAGLVKLTSDDPNKGDNSIKFKNVYLQTCINIYLYETKDYGMLNQTNPLNNKILEKKLKSIITFIMRLYMNTLPYYIYNLLYYIDDDDATYKSMAKDISVDLKTHNNLGEDEIYEKFMSAYTTINKDTINELCKKHYYSKIDCTSDNIIPQYLSNTNRKIFIGGDGDGYGDGDGAPALTTSDITELAQISFTNPYYLLNHTSMNLCLLNLFYNEIKTITGIKDFEEIKSIIKKMFDEIKPLIEADDVLI